MNPTYLLCIYIPLLVCIWLVLRRRRWAGFHQAARRRRDKGEKPIMEEIILKLMGKGVQVCTINDTLTGKLTHYAQGWLTLTDAKGQERYVNADYVTQMKEIAIKY